MKGIKYIILSLVLSLGFILQCEVFQRELWRFDQAYYLTSSYNVSEGQKPLFFKDVSQIAKKHGVHVFSTFMSQKGKHEMILNIYGDNEVRGILEKDNNVYEQTYISFFNGKTDVLYHDWGIAFQLSAKYNNFISFIGDEESVQMVYEEICKDYNITYPEYLESTEQDIIIIVWSLISLMMIIMNCIDVVKQKKEVVIRISLGESVRKRIIKEIMKDILTKLILYCIVRVFVFRFVSGEYQWQLSLVIYMCGCFISAFIYVAFAFFDVRRAFANVNDSKGVLYFMYGLKVVVSIVTVFTIATNLDSIHSNILANNEKEIINQFRNYSYLTIKDLSVMSYGLNEEELVDREKKFRDIWSDIYNKYSEDMKPVICVNVYEDKLSHILVNKNASVMIDDFLSYMSSESKKGDIIVFIPRSGDNEMTKNDAVDNIKNFVVNGYQSLNVQFVIYEKKHYITYLSNDAPYGMQTVTNPVLIYQNNDEVNLDVMALQNYVESDIIYDLTDIMLQELNNTYNFLTNGFELVKTNVYEAYQYRKSFVVRVVSFLSSLCVVVFILQIILIVAINSLEYRIHALELAVKKILGYGLWNKNRNIIVFSVGVDLLVTILLCIIMAFIRRDIVIFFMLTGIVITIVEACVVGWNIVWIEREKAQKALKGGCL